MKRFNLKDPKVQRPLLVAGLLLTLGFNLSWNPENTHIARYEVMTHGSTELATTAPSLDMDAAAPAPAPAPPRSNTEGQTPGFQVLDLSGFGLPGVRVRYALDDKKEKVVYQLEGKVCESCGQRKIQEMDVTGKNATMINMMLAQASQKLMSENQDSTKKDDKKTADDSSDCNKKPKDERFDCRKEQFTAKAATCDDLEGAKKSTCVADAMKIYNQHIKGTIQAGLNTDKDSAEFEVARTLINDLISDLPEAFDTVLKKPLMALIEKRVELEAAKAYRDIKATYPNSNNAYAATLALNKAYGEFGYQQDMFGQIGFRSDSILGDLRASMNASGNFITMNNAYLEAVQRPLWAFYYKDHTTGLTVDGTPGALLAPTSTPGLLPVPDALQAGAIDGRGLRGTMTLPAPYGVATGHQGVPYLANGQVQTPTAPGLQPTTMPNTNSVIPAQVAPVSARGRRGG